MKDSIRNGVWKRRKSRGPWDLLQGHKLNADQVREIRTLYKNGMSQAQIARSFDLSGRHVFDIVHRRKWKHIE